MQQLVEVDKTANLANREEAVITICGAGTLGASLAGALARRGFQRLRIIDRDWVEEANLTAQPYLPRDIGTPKALTLARALYDATETHAEPLVVELTECNAASLLAGCQIVIDAFDNGVGRHSVAKASATLDVPCLHLGVATAESNARYGLLTWEANEMLADANGHEDYPLPKGIANLMADASCETVVRFLLTGEKQSGKVPLE